MDPGFPSKCLKRRKLAHASTVISGAEYPEGIVSKAHHFSKVIIINTFPSFAMRGIMPEWA